MKKTWKHLLTTGLAIAMCAGMAISSQAAWKQNGGIWYYDLGNGRNATGWHNIDATWYYFNGGGQMLTGWQQIDGEWYYMRSSGSMVSDQWVGNYYLGSSGAMLKNTWVGPYYVGADGEWIPNYGGSQEEEYFDSELDGGDEFDWLESLTPVDRKIVYTDATDSFGNRYSNAFTLYSQKNKIEGPTYYTNGKYKEFRATLAPVKGLAQDMEFYVYNKDGDELFYEVIDLYTEPMEISVDIEGEKFVEICTDHESIYRTSGLIIADARFVY